MERYTLWRRREFLSSSIFRGLFCDPALFARFEGGYSRSLEAASLQHRDWELEQGAPRLRFRSVLPAVFGVVPLLSLSCIADGPHFSDDSAPDCKAVASLLRLLTSLEVISNGSC